MGIALMEELLPNDKKTGTAEEPSRINLPSPAQSTRTRKVRTFEWARCPQRPTGLSFRNRAAPSPHTGLRSLHSSRRTSNLARLAEKRSLKSDGKAGWFLPRPRPQRSGDVTRAGRAQPTTFLTLRAARQLAAAPRSRGVLRVLAAAAPPPPNSRARVPKPGVAGGRAPQKAALAQGPQLQERRYPNRERARRRTRAPRGPHSARAPVYKQARPRASTSARSRAAPTLVPDRPLPTPQGAGAREPRGILRSGAAPRSPGPSGSGPPARPRPPLCGVGPLSQARRFATSLPPLQPSPGDVVVVVVAAAAAAALPAGPAAPLGAPVPPSPLQDRQDFPLTAPWAPSYIQPSQPMGAECPSRDNRSVGSRES